MKRFLLLLGFVLITCYVFAQMGERTQRGRATRELAGDGLVAAHFSIPLDSVVKVRNTVTQNEIEVTIIARIPASSSRIIDLSSQAWDMLELRADTIVLLTFSPTGSSAPVQSVLNTTVTNEINRLNTTQSQTIYNLLILDRRGCAPNADLEDIENLTILYKYLDDTNGYLIALYISNKEGPVFPKMPDNSRILLNMTTVRKASILEYMETRAFSKFIITHEIIDGLLNALN